MRIKLNEVTARKLVEIMEARGFNTPTHTLNVVVSEYMDNLNPANEVDNKYGDQKGAALHKVQ